MRENSHLTISEILYGVTARIRTSKDLYPATLGFTMKSWLSSKNTFLHPQHPSILHRGRCLAKARFYRSDLMNTTRHSYRQKRHWSKVGKLPTTSTQLESTMRTQASLQKISFSYLTRVEHITRQPAAPSSGRFINLTGSVSCHSYFVLDFISLF